MTGLDWRSELSPFFCRYLNITFYYRKMEVEVIYGLPSKTSGIKPVLNNNAVKLRQEIGKNFVICDSYENRALPLDELPLNTLNHLIELPT